MAGVKGMAWHTRMKGGQSNFKFTFAILAFLASLPKNTKTAFIEQLIESSPAFQDWQKKRVEA